MTDVLFLRSEAVADLASPTEYVEAVREGYRQRGEGAKAAPRTSLTNADPPGILTGYFAILPDSGVMGGYTYAGGFESGDVHFVLPLFDVTSGEPLALLDGASLNPYKTGAVGGVAVDALARADASRVGILGSGTQARGQLRATATVRNLENVDVYSPTPENREAFAADLSEELQTPVQAVSSAREAVEGADIVITATRATEPVFDGEWLEPGTHVTAMGLYHPHRSEIDTTTVARSKYVIDLLDRLETDAGAYRLALDAGAIEEGHAHAELGEILVGDRPGRESDEEITLFDSGGTGIETVAAAGMLYERAREAGLGESIEFTPASEAFEG